MGSEDLGAVRGRWQELAREPGKALLRVGLLASFTADPVVPYLGVALHDAGLPVAFEVGPYNQVVQQCLGDGFDRPDVLVVAQRFEELAPDPADYTTELLRVVEAAASAARRWRSCLLVVLPAIPEHREHGAVDDGSPDAVPGAASAARQAVLAHLAGRPGVHVVDAEQAVRAVGTDAAHHPALFRFARIPYTEPVFAELGARLAGVLRAVYGLTPRAVVLDADPILDRKPSEVLVEQWELLRRNGVQLGLRASRDPWAALPADLFHRWIVDERPVREQCADLATAFGVPETSVALLTTGATEADRVVRLDGSPESWPALIRRSGLLDRLPVPRRAEAREQAAPVEVSATSLDDFVAGLRVEVDCEPVAEATAPKVAEVVSRAKDFTLGVAEVDLADGERELLAVRVRDRLGQYGISGAVGLRREGDECVVDVFSLSCPVLGKGVQDLVLREIRDRAGARPLVFRHRVTPHNQVATDFLAAVGLRVEAV